MPKVTGRTRTLNLGTLVPQLTVLTSRLLQLASARELALHRGGDTGARLQDQGGVGIPAQKGKHQVQWHGVKGRWGLRCERPCEPSRAAWLHPEPRGSLMDLTQGTVMGFVSREAAVETVEYGAEEGNIGSLRPGRGLLQFCPVLFGCHFPGSPVLAVFCTDFTNTG